MRLYSRRQILIAGISSFAAGAAVLGLVAALAGFRIGRSDASAETPPTMGRETSGSASESVDRVRGGAPAVADTVPVSDPPLTVTGSDGLTEDERNSIRVYEALNSAVVNITAATVEYDWFLNPSPQEGTGSGSILDQEGHVLTNYHVVQNAERISITLADGKDYEGRVVGKDPQNDLAVLKFDPQGLPLTTIAFGSSTELRVGQKVLAIGNPFGLERTLTTGIVSGLGRPIRTETGYIIREAIQTDASINPGNSGGPLLDSRGQMIGINTSIYSVSGGSIGLGFAVPVDVARRVVPELVRFGEVRRGWIGVDTRYLVELSGRLARYLRLSVNEGILVSAVPQGSAAQRAGLRGGNARERVQYGRSIIALGGDVIIGADGEPVAGLEDLFAALENNRPGETVELKVLRSGRQVALSVELEKMP